MVQDGTDMWVSIQVSGCDETNPKVTKSSNDFLNSFPDVNKVKLAGTLIGVPHVLPSGRKLFTVRTIDPSGETS